MRKTKGQAAALVSKPSVVQRVSRPISLFGGLTT